MRRGIVALLVLVAALGGCSGDGATDGAVSRATLHATDTEEFYHCPEVTAKRLAARATIAFSGILSIEGVDGMKWVIDVDHWYTGGDEDEMLITAGSPTIDYFAETVGSVRDGDGPYSGYDRPEDGDRLLVAAVGLTRWERREPVRHVGAAAGCLTQAWTPELDEVFRQAFPTNTPRPGNR